MIKMRELMKVTIRPFRRLSCKGDADPGIVLGLILTLIAIGLFIWFVVRNIWVVQP